MISIVARFEMNGQERRIIAELNWLSANYPCTNFRVSTVDGACGPEIAIIQE